MTTENTKYGDGALKVNNDTTPGLNSAFGFSTLRNNTSKWNTAIGGFAGSLNVGESNTCVGTNALLQNTTGNYNTALGTAAICFNILGNSNTAVGSNAMANTTNTTGSENTALGSQAGYTNSGNKNTFLGSQTDADLNTYTNSTAIGYAAEITASNQIKMGTSSETVKVPGILNTTNDASIHGLTVGRGGSGTLSDLDSNTAVGLSALAGNTTGLRNVAIGNGALQINNNSYNTAVGWHSLYSNTTGYQNTAVGCQSLATSSGDGNTAVGFWALLSNISSFNSAFGNSALQSNTTGTFNVAVGLESLRFNTTTSNNTAVGSYALKNNIGEQNTAVGRNACLSNTSGNNNTALGLDALNGNFDSSGNTALGYRSLVALTGGGGSNTAVGVKALELNTVSEGNTALGRGAGQTLTGPRNIVIGYEAEVPNITGGYQIAIGTAAETMYIRGGFNWKVGTPISGTGTQVLSSPLSQFYTVNPSDANLIIKLPDPTSAANLGATLTFKRIISTNQFTISAPGTLLTPFIPCDSVTPQLNISVLTSQYQVTLVCDGTYWDAINVL